MTTSLPLTPTKLAAIPEAPHNLQVLNFIAAQGHFVHEARPPSLSPMRNTQDRLFGQEQGRASLQGRLRSRSASIPLPATPPSPSVSRMAEQLSSSPILKERANNLPVPEAPRLSPDALAVDPDLESGVDIDKVKKRARGALQAKKVPQRKASTKNAKPEPVLELEETAQRLELRRTRRREKALIVQDRSRPVSARLRSEARAKDRQSKGRNKENIADDGRATVKAATKENKKLREAVLAMEAYKPVGRLGSGRMTTSEGIVKRGLFSKGAASAPVKVSNKFTRQDKKGKTPGKGGQLAFCEARFLQTEREGSEPDTDTEESATEPHDQTTTGELRQPRSKKHYKSDQRAQARKRPSSQLDHESEHDGDQALTHESGSEGSSIEASPEHHSRDRQKGRNGGVASNARPHYGRRRKRTLLTTGQPRNLLTSPNGAAEDSCSSATDAPDSDGDSGSNQSDLSEYSKARRKKAKAQQKHVETIRARQARQAKLNASRSRGRRSRGEEDDHSANHDSSRRGGRAATSKQAETTAREAAGSQAVRELPTRDRCKTAVTNGSDDSIYFDVRVKAKPATSHKRKLLGATVDEEALRASFEVEPSPKALVTHYRPNEAHRDRTEYQHGRKGAEHATGSGAHDCVPSEVSRWRGSAWTSPKDDKASCSKVSALQAIDTEIEPVVPAAYANEAESLSFDDLPQDQPDNSPRAPTPSDSVPSRLDLADLANGWRLQHTRPQLHSAGTADVLRRANTFAGCSIEQTALLGSSSSPRASLQDIRSASTHTPRVLTSSPRHNTALLSSTGLDALQLTDLSHTCEQPEEEHQLHAGDQRHAASDRSASQSYRASGPCTVDEEVEEIEIEEDAGSLRPFTAAAASTIYAGRAAWEDIKEAVDERNRSFSSDRPHEERNDAVWEASNDDALILNAPRAATPHRRMSHRRLSHLGSDAPVHDASLEEDIALTRQPSPLCLDRRGDEKAGPFAEHGYSEEDVFHSADDEGAGIVSGPVSQWSRQGSEVVEWLTPHSSQASQPCVLQQNLRNTTSVHLEPHQRLPSATTATRFIPRAAVSRLQLEERTTSTSTNSNSSFDDLDFLSIRPGPGRVAAIADASQARVPLLYGTLVGTEAGAAEVAGTHRVSSTQTRTRYSASGASQVQTGTSTLARPHVPLGTAQQQQQQRQGSTNFWTRQQAQDTRADISTLFRRESTEQQQEMHRAASSSLDPLDMDWDD